MEIDNVSPRDIYNSLNVDLNRNSVFKAGEGAGASGSFFFFSADKRFLIKTLRGNERKILLNMLDSFIKYLKDVGNQSLIAKIYGVYTVKTNVYSSCDFIVMQNTSRMINNTHPKMSFDMKGSVFKRKTILKEHFWLQQDQLNCEKILKDLNFMEIREAIGSYLLHLEHSDQEKLNRMVEADSKFLRSHNLMDYSLLFVVETAPAEMKSFFQGFA